MPQTYWGGGVLLLMVYLPTLSVFHTLQYSTVEYSTVQYSTVQYSRVQYSTVQYITVQYGTRIASNFMISGQ
jgi:hypothetical protein